MRLPQLDFSRGDPLLPLTAVANYAFRESGRDLNRYTPPSTRAFNTDTGDTLRSIARFFGGRGFQPAGWSGLPTDHVLMTGGGTTEGYELIIRSMATDVAAWNGRTGRQIRPALLMPVPTYGFFLSNLRHHGITPVFVPRDLMTGQVNPRHVAATLQKAHDDGYRFVGWYDSNPNNPTGAVRTEAETKGLFRLFSAVNALYARQDAAWQAENDRMAHTGIASRMRMIDDMVYDGLEYGDSGVPYAFAQIRDDVLGDGFADSFTLFGPSKAGLANLRAGLVVGPSDHLYPMRELQQSTGYSPSRPVVHALHAFFNDAAPFVDWRTQHLAHMAEEHQKRGRYMKALINGIDRVAMPETARAEMIADHATALHIGDAAAERRLKRGVPHVRIVTEPAAGFFHLLDLGALRGRTMMNSWGRPVPIKGDFDVERLFMNQELNVAMGGWMGLDDPFIIRASYANEAADIRDFASRLRAMVATTRPAP